MKPPITLVGRRSNCPLSCWLEIFGDKWTMLILRDLAMKNKHTFKDFMASPEKIASNILANRLKILVNNGIIYKERNLSNRRTIHYSLTPLGWDLAPIFREVANWSNKYIENTLPIEMPA